MTMAQFSRDDILLYRGLEQGLERGIRSFILDKIEDGVPEHVIIQKLQKHFMLDEETARQYCKTYGKIRFIKVGFLFDIQFTAKSAFWIVAKGHLPVMKRGNLPHEPHAKPVLWQPV